MQKSVVIIGGGASGILSSIIFKENGWDVCLLEKGERIGKKLLCTGNGKCNLTNLNVSLDDYNTPFVKDIIQRYSPEVVMKYFESLGLIMRVDDEKRVYPYSESATTILNVLLQKLSQSGVKTICECTAEKIVQKGDMWIVKTSKGDFEADKVVLATGSDATMGTNSHYLYTSLGHRMTKTEYAIAPLLCDDIKGANGVRAKVLATMYIDGEIVMSERGEFLFKDNALSGVLAFRLSSMLARRKGEFIDCKIVIDFLPDYSIEKLKEHIFNYSNVFNPLEGILHKAIAQNVIGRVPMDRSLIMSEQKALNLAKGCKHFEVKVKKVAGRQSAQVMSGGLDTRDFDNITLESKLKKGLYCTGEALDVDGLCGGYNLHWAWASAMACGGKK